MEKLAYKIAELLQEYDCHNDVNIYFNNKRLTYKKDNWIIQNNCNPKDYFEYVNEDTLSMSFESEFYEVLNYGMLPELEEKFSKLLEKHKLYYELGNAWNLSLYSTN